MDIKEHGQVEQEILRRNQQLAAAAEVARVATSTLDLDVVLNTSVELIREKFGFYHASVFLVEPDSNMAVLRESTGEAGTRLKASKHQLAIGSKSLVGSATATRQPVIVQDVTDDPTYFKNPLLPDTRAEAVIPMLSSDTLVGALDVQSTTSGSFSDSDVTILSTLADQLAVAIQNARLYASIQQELAERKRAEQALEEAKNELEIKVRERTVELYQANAQLQNELAERERVDAELENSLSTLQATLELTADGILVVDSQGKIVSFNRRFVEIWHIPDDVIESRDDNLAVTFVLNQLVDAGAFLAKVRELYDQPGAESLDTLLFKDGRVVERYSRSQEIAGQSVGRVWSFRDVSESKRAEAALQASEERYRNLFEDVPVGLYRSTPAGKFLAINAVIAHMLGYPDRQSLFNSSAIDVYVDPGDRQRWQKMMESDGIVRDFEFQLRRLDGTTIWVRDTARIERDDDGMVQYYQGNLEDITERKQAENALKESEERYALAMRGANDGLWDWNLKTNEVYYSPRWKSMLGCQDGEIGSSPEEWFKLIHPDESLRFRAELDSHLKGNTPLFQSEHRILHANGNYLWVLTRGLAVRDAKNLAYRIAGSQTDITVRKQAEERLAYDAFHDILTGLPNRALFLDRLEHAVKKVKRTEDDVFAVIFLDLDRFKLVNDSLGHAYGDQLLISIGERLQKCLRPGDTIARLGGDEFAILLEEVSDAAHATRVADRIQKELASPFILDGHSVSTSASIGITMGTTNYERAEDLLRDADTAMYRAKTMGKARHQIFDAGMHSAVASLLELEADLRKAIENDEFRVYYQPLVSLKSGAVMGTEALLRWQHPKRGLLPPAAFITILEETGMIVPVGEWVLRTACRQNKAWQDTGFPYLRIAVNFSARQFQIKNLPEMVKEVLHETGMAPETLELEITESTAIKDVEINLEILNQLHNLGVGISLDDFGSGYSALGYLNKYPFQTLKADRSFISDIMNDPNDAAITAAIIAMAHSLKLRVVAEGVETTEQMEFLRLNGCDEVQGFLFSRPIPDTDLTLLLQKKSLLPTQQTKRGMSPSITPSKGKTQSRRTKRGS